MVGACALRICLINTDVSKVTALGRSPTGIKDARLYEVFVDDFSDYSALTDALQNQDAALFCLGVYTGAVSSDLFRQKIWLPPWFMPDCTEPLKSKIPYLKTGTSVPCRGV